MKSEKLDTRRGATGYRQWERRKSRVQYRETRNAIRERIKCERVKAAKLASLKAGWQAEGRREPQFKPDGRGTPVPLRRD